jgi:hypothetical protein
VRCSVGAAKCRYFKTFLVALVIVLGAAVGCQVCAAPFPPLPLLLTISTPYCC